MTDNEVENYDTARKSNRGQAMLMNIGLRHSTKYNEKLKGEGAKS